MKQWEVMRYLMHSDFPHATRVYW